LNVDAGDRVEFVEIEPGRYEFVAATRTLKEFKRIGGRWCGQGYLRHPPLGAGCPGPQQPQKATCALANKLARICYATLRDHAPFDETASLNSASTTFC
jgi:hypothetical protein